MEEVFKPIDGFKGYYISNLGNVLSKKRREPIIMSQHTSRLGYQLVSLWKGDNLVSLQVARVVLEAFVGYPADPWLCYAHHKDGNLENCRLDNLEWIVCETTDEYDPAKSHRRGVLKPDTTKFRMTMSKYNQSAETIRKITISRLRTMELKKYSK